MSCDFETLKIGILEIEEEIIPDDVQVWMKHITGIEIAIIVEI
jgi:hypothetical protein